MPIEWAYQPPAISASILLEAAKMAAEMAGAEVLLAAAKPLVPVDTGELRDSGKVTHGPDGAEVSFTRSGPDGYNVAARQHEDATLNHPGGGESHFLSKPMTSEQLAILAGMAESIRETVG